MLIESMRTTPKLLALGGALLLASATESRALPPRQHTISGVITSMDHGAQTLTLLVAKNGGTMVFVWKDSTRFSQGWKRICTGALEAGQAVKIYYRREIGQLVPREVSLRTEAPARCQKGDCCLEQGPPPKNSLIRSEE